MFTIDRGLFIFHVNVPCLIENILRFHKQTFTFQILLILSNAISDYHQFWVYGFKMYSFQLH